MNDRMKAMGDFLLASLQHCEVMLNRKMFCPESQYNIHSDLYKLHTNLEKAYARYRETVLEASKPDFTLKSTLDAVVTGNENSNPNQEL